MSSSSTASDTLVIYKMEVGGAIEANFDALRAHIEALVADYADTTYARRDLKDAKRDRAYLNGLSKELNQRRLEVKRRYMAPVEAFESQVKALDALLREPAEAIDAQIKQMEADEAAAKRVEIKRHYEEYAGLLAESVPFERIEDLKWLNRTENLMAVFVAIEECVECIAEEEASLTDLNLSHPLEAKAEYFATLSMSAAIARSKALDEAEERTRRFEAEKAEILKQQEEDEERRRAEVRALAVEAAKEKPYRVQPEQPWPAPPPAPEPAPATVAVSKERVFTVTCTEAELDKIVAYINAIGLHGRVRTTGEETA